ncbi:stage II sporulation protein M [Paenibacillus beijingensis]|uniref:Stage II sporulation protein M n=1 Tax=Paenibacillus beijingensis TaxID=1126833 RepID=A0A0D5NPK6_9BACL|nr:stage II sporulation protein M [Paenibacillus beijingensis]AJY77234.1 stage II sporulation protein M [Paenibacillus beijingensis]
MSPQLLPQMKHQLTLYLFVIILFAVGVVFGTLMVGALTLEQQQNLGDELSSFIQYISAGIFPNEAQSFWSSLWFHAKWLLLIWVLGLTVVGMPFVLALDFLKGVLVGFTIGTLISQHAWKGLLFSLVSVAPPNLLAVPALMVASVAALSFSLVVIRSRLIGRQGPLLRPAVSFVTTMAVMFLALVGAAFVDAYLSPSLMQWAAPLVSPAAAG